MHKIEKLLSFFANNDDVKTYFLSKVAKDEKGSRPTYFNRGKFSDSKSLKLEVMGQSRYIRTGRV